MEEKLLSPVKERMSLSEKLAQQILAYIRSENLRPNEKLPSVRALAESFSVATPTLREALRRLESTGVIEIKHGSGTYVKEGAGRLVLSNPYRTHLGIHPFSEVISARLLIEPYLAELAAGNATDQDIAHLQALLKEASNYISPQNRNDRALHAANMSFHAVVAHASKHSVLAGVVDSLIDLYSYDQLTILSLGGNWHVDYSDHMAVLEAIRDRNPQVARRVMKTHLERVQVVVDSLSREADAISSSKPQGAEKELGGGAMGG